MGRRATLVIQSCVGPRGLGLPPVGSIMKTVGMRKKVLQPATLASEFTGKLRKIYLKPRAPVGALADVPAG